MKLDNSIACWGQQGKPPRADSNRIESTSVAALEVTKLIYDICVLDVLFLDRIIIEIKKKTIIIITTRNGTNPPRWKHATNDEINFISRSRQRLSTFRRWLRSEKIFKIKFSTRPIVFVNGYWFQRASCRVPVFVQVDRRAERGGRVFFYCPFQIKYSQR